MASLELESHHQAEPDNKSESIQQLEEPDHQSELDNESEPIQQSESDEESESDNESSLDYESESHYQSDQPDNKSEDPDNKSDPIQQLEESDNEFGSDNESSSDYGSESDEEWEPYFQEIFNCFPMSQYESPHLEVGDKIIMPPSSLARIDSLGIDYPFVFKLRSYSTDAISYCGVLQFDAEEGSAYMPEWMMKNLNIKIGEPVVVSSAADVSKGVYMKLQPHTSAFLELADPRAVLEKTLRDFTCLGSGSTIMIKHNRVDLYFDVLEVSPGDVITLIETDCQVEFAPPLDYMEPTPQSDSGGGGGSIKREKEEEVKEFKPFMGKGQRLDGKTAAVAELLPEVVIEEKNKSGKDEGKGEFKPFTGKSRVLGAPSF